MPDRRGEAGLPSLLFLPKGGPGFCPGVVLTPGCERPLGTVPVSVCGRVGGGGWTALRQPDPALVRDPWGAGQRCGRMWSLLEESWHDWVLD